MTFPLFYLTTKTLLSLWYFGHFLLIKYFIISLPVLSTVFYHSDYHSRKRQWREGWEERQGRKKKLWQIQRQYGISITLYAWSGQSRRVINWHVAAGQQCIALVRCPQCNKMQWEEREWKRKARELSVDWDLKKGCCWTIYLGRSLRQWRRLYQYAGLRWTKWDDIHSDK